MTPVFTTSGRIPPFRNDSSTLALDWHPLACHAQHRRGIVPRVAPQPEVKHQMSGGRLVAQGDLERQRRGDAYLLGRRSFNEHDEVLDRQANVRHPDGFFPHWQP